MRAIYCVESISATNNQSFPLPRKPYLITVSLKSLIQIDVHKQLPVNNNSTRYPRDTEYVQLLTLHATLLRLMTNHKSFSLYHSRTWTVNNLTDWASISQCDLVLSVERSLHTLKGASARRISVGSIRSIRCIKRWRRVQVFSATIYDSEFAGQVVSKSKRVENLTWLRVTQVRRRRAQQTESLFMRFQYRRRREPPRH